MGNFAMTIWNSTCNPCFSTFDQFVFVLHGLKTGFFCYLLKLNFIFTLRYNQPQITRHLYLSFLESISQNLRKILSLWVQVEVDLKKLHSPRGLPKNKMARIDVTGCSFTETCIYICTRVYHNVTISLKKFSSPIHWF
jgi:hypothetical protein